MGTWSKRREVLNRERKIKNKKLREHHYVGRYARYLESKRLEWDERNIEEI